MDEIIDLTIKLAKPFEGLHKIGEDGLIYAYADPVGFSTQGWGRLLSRNPWEDLSKYPPITQDQAEEWLRQDLKKAVSAALRLCPGATTNQQCAALTDFAFNCGAGNLEISTLRRKVNRGDFAGAELEFERWVYARGVKLPGLVRRRKAEANLFVSSSP